MIKRLLTIGCICLTLTACATQTPSGQTISLSQQSYLAKGKEYFNEGRFKSAMRLLLPLAGDGIGEAEYAVGYMYYYGFGVAKDEEVGLFWINRAAKQSFQPAIKALKVIQRNQGSKHSHNKSTTKRVALNHELHNLNLETAEGRFQHFAELRKKLALSFRQPIA